jgi:hypothetical protein
MNLYVVSSDSDTPVHPISAANIDAVVAQDPRPHSRGLSLSQSTRNRIDVDKTIQDNDPDWVKEFTPSRSQEPRANAPSQSVLDAGSGTDLRTLEAANGDDEYSGLDTGVETVEENGTQLVSKVTDRIEETQNMAPAPRKPPQSHSGKAKSSLPLTTAPKIDQNLVLVQAQADAFDLSGDVGAVGRVKVDHTGVYLDVKGVLYSCGIHEINTVCVVSVGDDDARITAVLDEALTLHQDQTIFNAGEHLVSGILDEEDLVDGASGNASGSTALRPTSGPRKLGNPKASRVSKTRPKPKSKSATRPRSRAKPKVKK